MTGSLIFGFCIGFITISCAGLFSIWLGISKSGITNLSCFGTSGSNIFLGGANISCFGGFGAGGIFLGKLLLILPLPMGLGGGGMTSCTEIAGLEPLLFLSPNRLINDPLTNREFI